MQTSNHLESLAREKIIELFQDNICFAFVFGSFAKEMTKTAKEIDPIVESFRSLASSIFKENLLFGFVFGSAAKGKLKVKGSDSDDLDTFICLKEASPNAVDEYLQKLAVLHAKYHLKVDTTFPAEIMTLATLTEVL